ncbi:hypothetical protein ACOZ38_39060 [Sphaerisporangium viridialbum]|uniref:hypothetical protein n=1 Tax=Sphaerisporangium viridialbum TaxID=46189 RepID=UPI003C709C60
MPRRRSWPKASKSNDCTAGLDDCSLEPRSRLVCRGPSFDGGQSNFRKYREELAGHPIEKTGAKLRPMMSWLKEK